MANDPRINDLCEAVSLLAKTVGELAAALSTVPELSEAVASTKRVALEAELMAGRVLLNP